MFYVKNNFLKIKNYYFNILISNTKIITTTIPKKHPIFPFSYYFLLQFNQFSATLLYSFEMNDKVVGFSKN